MTARILSAVCGDVIMRCINSRPTPAERLDWARIAHADKNITDAQLAFYEEAARERA